SLRSPPPPTSSCVWVHSYTSLMKTSPLSLHDALPISDTGAGLVIKQQPTTRAIQQRTQRLHLGHRGACPLDKSLGELDDQRAQRDRKSTRLNSSHVKISYTVFCLTKKMR